MGFFKTSPFSKLWGMSYLLHLFRLWTMNWILFIQNPCAALCCSNLSKHWCLLFYFIFNNSVLSVHLVPKRISKSFIFFVSWVAPSLRDVDLSPFENRVIQRIYIFFLGWRFLCNSLMHWNYFSATQVTFSAETVS